VFVSLNQTHQIYAEKMGGFDLFDKLTGLYCIWIQSRKLFWPLFRFANLWSIY